MMARSVVRKADSPECSLDRDPVDARRLNALAIAGLPAMFDEAKGLFCYRLKRQGTSLVQEGLSHRYTIMTCLGLQRCKAAGLEQPFDTRGIVAGLLRNLDWIDDIGDLGLLLWLCAVEYPDELRSFCLRADVKTAPDRFVQARQARTMQMAWLLTGLAYASQTHPQLAHWLEPLAVETFRSLVRNQGPSGAFGHLRSRGNLLRSHIGSFADQIYPIVAFTRFAEAFNVAEGLVRAQRCAEMICRHQGSLGQWWWHYSSSSGKVVEKYPVYSVHQDGMAPMGLFAIGEAVGRDFSEPISKGLRWITGMNELGVDLRDQSAGTIWRSLYHRSSVRRQMSRVLGAIGIEGKQESGDALQVRFECRPYHFGWLLYAFAGREWGGTQGQ